jgi:Acetyltransferase (GNAT) domain
MPIYRNPDFRRLPGGLAAIFDGGANGSFFSLPGWYDLMARHGVAEGTEIRAYTDERPASATAILVQTVAEDSGRSLTSLTNAHSLEHSVLCAMDSDVEAGLTAAVSQICSDRPQWDRLTLSELDPRDPSYPKLASALRAAGLLVEYCFSSGTWYEETDGMNFADYVAARPSQLRNTWRRKRRSLDRSHRLTRHFVGQDIGIDEAIGYYQTIYQESWKPAEFFPNFVPGLIRLADEHGALRLGLYFIDGRPAAAQFWIVWNRRAVICKLAHDKRFDELSLGTLLTMDMFERVLAEDRPVEISLGRGDDPYKKLWLPKRRERWGIVAANPRTLRGLRFGLRRRAATAYHRLRRERITPLG